MVESQSDERINTQHQQIRNEAIESKESIETDSQEMELKKDGWMYPQNDKNIIRELSKELEPIKRANPIFENVSGFIAVENEEDLYKNMKSLSSLFTEALDVEVASSTTKKKKKRELRKTQTQENEKRIFAESANSLLQDEKLLEKVLEDPVVIEAIRATGIDKNNLMAKSLADFEKEHNRSWKVNPDIRDLRYQFYEKQRKDYLTLILEVANETQDQMEEEQKLEDRTTKEINKKVYTKIEQEMIRQQKMIDARKKFEEVVEKEGEIIENRRKEFENYQRECKEREKRILEGIKQKQQELWERSMINKEKQEKVKKQKALLEKMRSTMISGAGLYDNSRLEKVSQYKKESYQKRQQILTEKLEKRKQIQKEARKAEIDKMSKLQEQINEKERYLERVLKERFHQDILSQERKKLLQQQKVAYVQRMRSAKKYKSQKEISKIQGTYNRIETMKNLRNAILDERSRAKKDQIIEKDLWRAQTPVPPAPGPGEYETISSLSTTGGTWGQYRPKSDIEWSILRASTLPGPGDYELGNLMATEIKGGTLSRTKAKSSTELMIEKSAFTPGPGAYFTKLLATSPATKFGNTESISELDMLINRAREEPGPGHYSPQNFTESKPTFKDFRKLVKPMTAPSNLYEKRGIFETAEKNEIMEKLLEDPDRMAGVQR